MDNKSLEQLEDYISYLIETAEAKLSYYVAIAVTSVSFSGKKKKEVTCFQSAFIILNPPLQQNVQDIFSQKTEEIRITSFS